MEIDSKRVVRGSFECQPFVPFNALSIMRNPTLCGDDIIFAVGCSTYVMIGKASLSDLTEMATIFVKTNGIHFI